MTKMYKTVLSGLREMKAHKQDRRTIDRTPERLTLNAPRLRQIW